MERRGPGAGFCACVRRRPASSRREISRVLGGRPYSSRVEVSARAEARIARYGDLVAHEAPPHLAFSRAGEGRDSDADEFCDQDRLLLGGGRCLCVGTDTGLAFSRKASRTRT